MTVVLDQVTIRYGSTVAVDCASFTFPQGAVGLLGRNGAGKSSILKAILGLVRPTAGSMRILDLAVTASPLDVRRRIGYMPERDCHIPGLSGYETVLLLGRLAGLPYTDAARRTHEVLYLVGLDEQRYRPVSGYSAGMRQKVKLAAALVHDPDVLFLDEPTNGLDPGGRQEMLEVVKKLAGPLGKSVVLSSHILQDVEDTCSHVVLMERGRVLASGSLLELTRRTSKSYELETSLPFASIQAPLLAAGALSLRELTPVRLSVSVPAELPVARVFQCVRTAGGTVLRLVEQRHTLEEVFLGAVAEAGAGRLA